MSIISEKAKTDQQVKFMPSCNKLPGMIKPDAMEEKTFRAFISLTKITSVQECDATEATIKLPGPAQKNFSLSDQISVAF